MSRALHAAAVVGAVAFLGTASPLAAASYWVSGTGSDVNDCSEKRPCREIQTTLARVLAGDTIWVRAGSYAPFDVTRPGPIAIRSLDPARTFVAPRRDESSSIHIVDTAHITIDGLQVPDARFVAIAVRNSRSIWIRNGLYHRSEAACIHIFGSDLVTIENNECTSRPSADATGVLIQNSNQVTVRGNRIYDNARPGIVSAADEVARGLLVEGNRIYGNIRGVDVRGPHEGATLRNNLVYDNLEAGIVLQDTRWDLARAPLVIEHNTVVQPAVASRAVDLSNVGPVRVRNNVLLQPHAGFGVGLSYRYDADVPRTNSDHNVLATVMAYGMTRALADWQAQGHELHSVAATPSELFVDAAAKDFRLRAGAPAVDRGQETEVGIDLAGEPRPGGAGWDLGAYERPGGVDPAPAGFRRTPIGEPLVQPTTLALAADGRIFVGEQTGALRVIKHGRLLPVPFAVLPVSSEGERGLLGVALDPAFPAQPYVYVYYTTAAAPVHNRVARLTASGDVAVPGSERALLDMPALDSLRHPGGAMDFGVDGKLYVAVGDDDLDVPPARETDDGDDADPQRYDRPFGKVLRLNPDPANPIPSDNPFASTGGYRALWAVGLRNPRGLAARPGTPQIFVNDAGATWQEIDEVEVRANYGWPRVDGPSNGPTYRAARYVYRAEGGAGACAIAGGAFYNPTHVLFPLEHAGDYFFADRCAGWIRSYDPQSRQVREILGGFAAPIDVKAGADGALYVLSQGDGRVHRVSHPSLVRLLASPMDQTAREGEPVTFAVRVTGSDPFTYQWQRNGTDLPGATGPAYTLPAVDLADSGARFRCVVMNPLSVVTSSEAQLTVAPAWRLAIGDATALEPPLGGSRAAVFTVSLSRTSTEPVSVSFETRSGTALAGEDFEPRAGRLVFPPGATSLQVEVPVRVDLLPEPPERFSVLLSGPVGATIVDGTGVGTILEGETE